MTLYEVLTMIEPHELPLKIELDGTRKDIDSRPNSIYKVCICFMAEEETWVTTYPRNEILIPWYECEVSSFYPTEDCTLEIWLKDVEFLEERGLIGYGKTV